MKTELIGSVALVTGAARGIGRACASALVDAGATTVYSVDCVAHKAIPGAKAVVLDVSCEDDVRAFLDTVPIPVQVLVNNAGICVIRNGLDITVAEWRRIFDVNVIGTFLMTRYVSAKLIAEGLPGAIVNLGSTAGKRGYPNEADYCSSKAAVIGFTRAASLDLARYAITVNAVAPGTIDTPMMAQIARDLQRVTGLDDGAQREALVKDVPIGRMLQPEEVGAAVCFLLSRSARAITGETLTVDGGLSRD